MAITTRDFVFLLIGFGIGGIVFIFICPAPFSGWRPIKPWRPKTPLNVKQKAKPAPPRE